MGYNFYANYELLCIMRIETLDHNLDRSGILAGKKSINLN